MNIKSFADGNELSTEERDLLAYLLVEEGIELSQTQSLPPIISAPEKRHQPFTLTNIQQAYWIGRSEALELGNVAAHAYWEIESINLDLERYEKAWQRLIERHEMLRAIVLPSGEQQILDSVPPYEIQVLDLRGESLEVAASQLEATRQKMSHQILPTDQWPLFEIRASVLDERCIRQHISFDLLIGDDWSLQILLQELWELYQDVDTPLGAIAVSFRDYVLACVALQDSSEYERSRDYWLRRVHTHTLPPAPELPLAKHPSLLHSPRFVRRSATLQAEIWQQLKTRANQAGLTPSGVLLAAFAEVLRVWSKCPQFTINLTLFNRLPLHPQINEIVGDFTSLSLLAIDNSTLDSFETHARNIQEQLWEDLDHRYFDGVEVLRELARIQGQESKALMPVVFTSTLTLTEAGQNTDPFAVFGSVVYSITQTPQVWLDHQVYEEEETLVFNWDAVEELFPGGFLDDMFEAYCGFLFRLANDESAWLETRRQLLPDSQLKLFAVLNATTAPLPDLLLHTLFEAQVKQHPHHAAIIAPKRTLTYQELHSFSQALGHRLRHLGAKPNTLVAVVMEKGWEQVVAVLGILAAGAAYIPIDPGLPMKRQWHLLEQAEVQLVLTQSKLNQTLEWPSGVYCICVDTEELVLQKNDLALHPVQQSEDLAYVIYTSGSTGMPKGVMIDHRGAVNTILDINKRFDVNSSDRVFALSSLSFDLSVYDIFGTLAAGATIVIPQANAAKDPSHWLNAIAHQQITVWNSVPALMQMLVEYAYVQPEFSLTSLRLVLLSGDWLPLTLPPRIKAIAKNVQVISLGGATEASIWSILYPIETIDPTWKSIPYGCPMTNQQFYILNEALEACPVWVPGQLYIGGIGLAKGYWRDEQKTAASFITHPVTGSRLYRTGDLGCYLPNGQIEFLGREGYQVKVNGYRIELGEIETALQKHSAVKEAVVTALGELHYKQLVAYVVPDKALVPAQHRPLEAYEPLLQEGVILDPVERVEFKLKQPGLQRLHPEQQSILLPKPEFDEVLTQTYLKRQSYRQFLDALIPLEQFSRLLSCLMQMQLDGYPLPKYRYASAGSLYPVQIYLYVKPNRIEGLEAGLYYYHPADHRLVLLRETSGIAGSVYGSNQPIFEQSAFSLFLIGKLRAIAPMYGEMARDFCLLEAGYISQLLMESAPEQEIGFCPIGSLQFNGLQDLFGLEPNQVLLHSFVGGRIDPAQPQHWLQPKTSEHSGSVTDELRRFLQHSLPEYMIPSAFVQLEALPLTPNGKVDRKALPMPELSQSEQEVSVVQPRDALELQLVQIWLEVLNLHVAGVQDNFFDVGGNSLLAIRLINQIQLQFGTNLPLATLFESPTIEHLASILRQQGNSLPWSPLVTIQPHDSRQPLFCVHPAGGNVLCYVDLARHLGSDQPFYGLQAAGLNEEWEPHTQVEDMAAHYVKVLQTLQLQVPYLLAGWSFGGLVAFEMAQQLQAQGQEVAFLGLLDTYAPSLAYETQQDDAEILVNLLADENISLSLKHLQQLEPDEQLIYIMEQTKQLNLLPPDSSLAQVRHLLQVYKTNIQAARNYTPQPYSGRIAFFQAREKTAAANQEAALGWEGLVSEAFEVYSVPGNHQTIVRKPHVQILAEQLRACLDRALGRRSSNNN